MAHHSLLILEDVELLAQHVELAGGPLRQRPPLGLAVGVAVGIAVLGCAGYEAYLQAFPGSEATVDIT